MVGGGSGSVSLLHRPVGGGAGRTTVSGLCSHCFCGWSFERSAVLSDVCDESSDARRDGRHTCALQFSSQEGRCRREHVFGKCECSDGTASKRSLFLKVRQISSTLAHVGT